MFRLRNNATFLVVGLVPVAGCSFPSSAERSLRASAVSTGALANRELALRWLGTAGYEVRYKPAGANEVVLLIDPFFTRPGLPKLLASSLFDLSLPSNEDQIVRLTARHQLALNRASHILIAHGHYDHLMDAPGIALRNGAKLVGSKTAVNIARGLGVPEPQLIDVEQSPEFDVGPIHVKAVESKHVKLIGNYIYNTGEVLTPPSPPLSARDFKLGRQFNYLLEVDGLRIYHHGCADLIDDNVRAVGDVDVLIVGLALRKHTPDFLGRILTLTNPKIVIPTHHDDFFLPFGFGVWVMFHTHFGDFVETVRTTAPQARIVTLDFFQEYRLNAATGP